MEKKEWDHFLFCEIKSHHLFHIGAHKERILQRKDIGRHTLWWGEDGFSFSHLTICVYVRPC